ncbi:MAG TPA: hypothetical protein V6C71_12130 [Coleofasciculaceae cyanobacterium]
MPVAWGNPRCSNATSHHHSLGLVGVSCAKIDEETKPVPVESLAKIEATIRQQTFKYIIAQQCNQLLVTVQLTCLD